MQVRLGLCAGRHEMPVNTYIFERIDNPMDFYAMECAASKRIWFLLESAGVPRVQTIVGIHGSMDSGTRYVFDCELLIYVTGLSSALIAALNALQGIGVKKVSLMHFDKEADCYKEQFIVW